MIYTVAEAYRNLIASNIKPMAITNNLNFASPLDPNIMGEIVLSVNGLKISASQLDTPIVSGNVSLYNQTNDAPINPTPVIGMVGSNSNINKIVSNKFQSEGDIIISIGENIDPHKSPYFLQDQEIVEDINLYNELENINLEDEKITAKILMEISDNNLLQSCNDISRGGIFMTLMKMIQKNYGFNIKASNDFELFCEYKSGYVTTIKENNLKKVFALLDENKINYEEIGRVVIEEIKINSKNIDYFDIKDQYLNNFERIIN
jgi:phosphoribosylformylglycinamidine synthase